jgi:predicted metal-dependent hydrolase
LILNSTIYFYINKEEDKKYLIKKFYIEMSELYFTPNVEKWAKTMGIKYNKIQYKNVFSKLGSCDTHGNLIFSSWLVALDLKIYSSIIVHELAHTLQMNHSKKFYEIVYKYMPDYDNLQKEISKYSIVY